MAATPKNCKLNNGKELATNRKYFRTVNKEIFPYYMKRNPDFLGVHGFVAEQVSIAPRASGSRSKVIRLILESRLIS